MLQLLHILDTCNKIDSWLLPLLLKKRDRQWKEVYVIVVHSCSFRCIRFHSDQFGTGVKVSSQILPQVYLLMFCERNLHLASNKQYFSPPQFNSFSFWSGDHRKGPSTIGKATYQLCFVCSIFGNNGVSIDTYQTLFSLNKALSNTYFWWGGCVALRGVGRISISHLSVEIRLKLRKFTATRHQEITWNHLKSLEIIQISLI